MNIDYISGVPGVGKTKWAVQEAADRSMNAKGLTFYIAPTIALLTQFKKDLDEKLKSMGAKAKERDNVVILASLPKHMRDASRLPVAEVVTRYLQGTLTPGAYLALKEVSRRTVILITHTTLYKVNLEEVNKEMLKEAHVIFDEAKKSIFSKSLRLTNKSVATYMSRLIRSKSVNSYFQLGLRKNKDGQDLDLREIRTKLISEGLASKELTEVEDIFNYLKGGKVDVYMSQRTFKVRSKVNYLTLPLKVFKPFGKVTLMAAHIEQSQMYAMLWQNTDITLTNISATVPWYYARHQEVMKRYEKVKIIPLTLQDDSVLSLYRLANYLAPKARVKYLRKFIKASKITAKDLVRAEDHIKFKSSPNLIKKESAKVQMAYRELTRKKNRIERNPIEWLLRSAEKITKHLNRKNKNKKALLFINRKYEHLADRIDYFNRVSTFCYGINSYQDSNVAVYLAAINPAKAHVTFLRAFLGKRYSYVEDYTMDTCLQCISRTSIRDTKSNEPVYVIVPDLAMAKMVKESLGGVPNIDERYAKKLGDKRFFTPKVVTEASKEEKQEVETERKQSLVFRDRNKYYVVRSRYRKSQEAKGQPLGNREKELTEWLEFMTACMKKKFTDEEYLAAKKEKGYTYQ